MKKRQGFSVVAVMLALTPVSLPVLATEQAAILDTDISQSFVSTVTTSRMNGFLSIANGRNCLVADTLGQPSLVSCPTGEKAKTVISTFTVIEVAQGRCLSDGEQGPELKRCDINDPDQQWRALPTRSTEVRNQSSNRCLTATGLNKPVTLEACSGLPSQAWTLPH